MNPEKELSLIDIIEAVYHTKLVEAGIKPSYEELEGTEFECESFSLEEVNKLSLDQLLDRYNDYRALYYITDESKFLSRAHFYSVQAKKKMKQRKKVS